MQGDPHKPGSSHAPLTSSDVEKLAREGFLLQRQHHLDKGDRGDLEGDEMSINVLLGVQSEVATCTNTQTRLQASKTHWLAKAQDAISAAWQSRMSLSHPLRPCPLPHLQGAPCGHQQDACGPSHGGGAHIAVVDSRTGTGSTGNSFLSDCEMGRLPNPC